MSTIKLDLQKFGAGAGTGGTDWSAGITISAVDAARDAFKAEIEATKTAILDYTSVDTALQNGWSGSDCVAYLEKFHAHAESVCNQIDTYYEAVSKTVEEIKTQWQTFQDNLIK